jgi:glucosamine-6-phosphate deaminase
MNVLIFDSEEAWAEGAASLWRDRLRTKPDLRICLPSGNTPKKVFAAMARSVAAGQVSFGDAEAFVLDEFGGLSADDAGRCANMIRRDLLDRVDLPAARFHMLDVDAENLDAVCRAYDGALGAGLDLTILGVGLNGHLGMNEPGSPPDSTTRRVELHESTVSASARYLTHAHLPTWGVTVGLKQLLASKEVWVLANGRGKAEIVKRALTGEVSTGVPASLLRRHPNCSFILDAAAAELLLPIN